MTPRHPRRVGNFTLSPLIFTIAKLDPHFLISLSPSPHSKCCRQSLDPRTMATLSSEEDEECSSERCGSYSPSADVSCQSESSSSFFGEASSSPRRFYFPAPVMLPVIGGKDVVWDDKIEKHDSDLSGKRENIDIALYYC